MRPLKLLVIGPTESGKTVISNFLAEATEIPFEYRPTQGVRILEFEIRDINVNDKKISRDIELWDCSGDFKFENCWPAMRKELKGVLFVYSKKSREAFEKIKKYYDYFITQTKLEPHNAVILFYDPDRGKIEMSKTIVSTFAKISQVRCNVEVGGNQLKDDFRSYLGTLITKMQEYADKEERIIINDNVLLRE